MFNTDLHAYCVPNKGKTRVIVTEIGYITVQRDWEFTELVIVGKVLYFATRTVKRSITEL